MINAHKWIFNLGLQRKVRIPCGRNAGAKIIDCFPEVD